MDTVKGALTVYFEAPFWVGVLERVEDGQLSVSKITFGAEPKDYEVYEFVRKYYFKLRFSPPAVARAKEWKRNPKRVQREVKKQLQNSGIGTKSQQALKLQHEQNKQERKTKSRAQRQEEKRLFALKQQKKKENIKGIDRGKMAKNSGQKAARSCVWQGNERGEKKSKKSPLPGIFGQGRCVYPVIVASILMPSDPI